MIEKSVVKVHISQSIRIPTSQFLCYSSRGVLVCLAAKVVEGIGLAASIAVVVRIAVGVAV